MLFLSVAQVIIAIIAILNRLSEAVFGSLQKCKVCEFGYLEGVSDIPKKNRYMVVRLSEAHERQSWAVW